MTDPAPELRLVPPEPEAPVDPMIGRTLDGRYAIESLLGKGGMGLVYAARHAMLNKRLAIKVLKEEVSKDEQVMARFRREAQSASAIGSPHICDVSDFGTMPDGSKYFVMEYLDGPPLTDAMKQSAPNPMESERIVSIGMQLCDALGAAHERGIVHRDLKPDNVHIVQQGNRSDFVKVQDFGIAKVGGAADKKLTQAGQVFGTPHYMSPEQCSGREVDHRTDIYALGVMLYEMATGVVPFDADNLMGVLTKHVYEQPIPPRELPPPVEVPVGLESVILKCLAKQPEERYQTMAELKADLKKVSQGATPDAVMQSVERASGVPRTQMMQSSPALEVSPGQMPSMASVEAVSPLPQKSRAPAIVLGLLGMLVLGVGAFAGAFFLGGEGTPTPTAEATPAPVAPEPEPEPVAPEPEPEPEPQAEAPAPAPERTTVRLLSEPEGAEIYTADGALIGNAPIDLPRPASGESTQVTVRAAGHEERQLTVSHLTSAEVTVRLDQTRRVASAGRHRPRPRPQPQAVAPTPQPLAPTTPSRPPPPRNRRSSLGSEIIDPF